MQSATVAIPTMGRKKLKISCFFFGSVMSLVVSHAITLNATLAPQISFAS